MMMLSWKEAMMQTRGEMNGDKLCCSALLSFERAIEAGILSMRN
jgi:hypothetical protein